MKKIRKQLAALLAILMMATCMLTACGRRSRTDTTTTTSRRQTSIGRNSDSGESDSSKSIITNRRSSTSEMSSEQVAEYSKTRVAKVVTDVGTGSGFFIDSNGTMVTNYHVIEGAGSLSVRFDTGAKYDVLSVIDFSPFYDIAVLEVDISGNDYFELASSYTEGEKVYVRGYPKGVDTSSFTSGMMSQSSHQLGLMDCITIDAAINNGNSGGPAMNSRGQVLGICSYSMANAENMNFAIKLSALDKLDMDKNYNINRYQEWYNREISRSYMASGDGKTYSYTYINTFTTVTGVACELSYNSERDYEEGYSIAYAMYNYAYNTETYDAYCDYLNSIGFVYQGADRDLGYEGVQYYDPFNGYTMILAINTVDNYLIISCPII